ncbi:MAG TPA: CsgG/HfaB family protein [Limnochordia bacterium]|jgi:curli production assembly/transport component CsgG|nr:curli production assembly protein CsgG [Bacillota bacterium]HKM43570.1 CsgG/HfaB family protein [Limnochordia bacterium]
MEFLMIGLLAIGLLIGGAAGGETPPPPVTEVMQDMEAVLAAPETILMSETNITTASQLLAALPEPKERIPISIYAVTDSTGQFKADGGASSTVVTQGSTEMLITALQRSRQFTILDRVRFGDLMNEQNLISSSRIAPGQGPELGALTGANYMITGSITEYQVSKETGGIGLVIAGKGGSTEYAKASVALDLRVINLTTGEVIWAESLKGEIIGEKVGLQLFSFLGKNIVEFETGQGKQQVINLVVRTLLEEAVFKLVQSQVLTN